VKRCLAGTPGATLPASVPHHLQRRRAAELLRRQGISVGLFSHPHSVTWLTGFVPPLQVGPTPFLGNPGFVWFQDEQFVLFVQDTHLELAADLAGDGDIEVVPYVGFTVDRPIDIMGNIARALVETLGGRQIAGRVGVERRHLSTELHRVLQSRLGARARPEGVDDILVPLRTVKTEEELFKLRASFALVEHGHRVARSAVQPGRSEIEIWTAVQAEVLRAAGRRVPLGNDCVAGERPANIGGWPGELRLVRHSSLTLDLGAGLDGYWSDSCATYYAEGPTAEQRAAHQVAADALEFAIDSVRPGVSACRLDASMRSFVADRGYPVYPHHSGHGVGVSLHEEPRLTPYNQARLEAGMVLMLEPGIYFPGRFGIRLEDAVLVTADGAEPITRHDKGL
jgi:Xaa-Pro dipeptidase